MIPVRVLRDLAFAAVGALCSLAFTAPGRLPHPAPAAQAGPPPGGEMAAWTLADRADGLALLDWQSHGLIACRLPSLGRLHPLLDERSGRPTRLRHWIEGGPQLYLMRLDASAPGDEPAGGTPISADAAALCPPGRVLAPAETILNFLYQRSGGNAAAP